MVSIGAGIGVFEGQDQIVASSNVLMVGAGGIGCELVKTLALTGFRRITMVDMDTIEISNLNRQFLFRKHHVGQSKAEVAAEAVRAFCPDMKITALQDNVKDSKFDLDFIKGFDMVLNGLDNDEARRHVNRLCLATGTPLVESGTMGYRGQVSVHLTGESECYECMPRPKPKGYPVCTIRNTPVKPIHCVVWAKDLLFMRLFGPPEAVTDLDEVQEKDGEEKPADEAMDASEFLRRQGEGSWQYALRIFEKVFNADIQRLLGMEDLWKTHARPTVLKLQKLLPDAQQQELPAEATSASKLLQLDPQAMWDTADNARVFLHAIALFHERRSADVGSASFDKDDDLAMDFVTAASNLRSRCYGIPLQSEFTVKGMAGNIIHAIATTNAVISGLIVTEALKLIAGCKTALRKTYLMETPNQYGKMTQPSQLAPANTACMVCSHATVCLSVDTGTFTLANLVDKVLKQSMAFNSPSILADDFMYEEGDGLDEDEVADHAAQLPKALSALPGGGIKHNSQISVTDQTQDMTVTIVVRHTVLDADEHPDGFVVEGSKPVTAATAAPDVAGPSRPSEDDDDLEVVDDAVRVVSGGEGRGTKRKYVDPSAPSCSKTPRLDDDVIELD